MWTLEDDTSYEVRIKANNGERASAWSATGTGRTNKANHDPRFDDRPGTGAGSERGDSLTVWRTIDENPRSGQTVGRVFADDEDNDRLTYKLSGTDVEMFDINKTTGEIRTKAGVTYNYEAITQSGTCGDLDPGDVGSDKCYEVTVEVRDGLDMDRVEVEETDPDDRITVKIGVRNRDEPPAVPTVIVTSPADNTKLIVTWHAGNTGPVIIDYDVQYRKGGGIFSDDNCQDILHPTTATTIRGLEEDTSYSVQVRARNAEGTSAWSRVATVRTNKGTNNLPPTFTDGATAARTVDENTSSRLDVGLAFDASDDSSTTLTYSLGGPDAALFTIAPSSGQIRTRSALNTEAVCSDSDGGSDGGHQENCTYTVWVKVDDRAGGSDSTVVTITVKDVDEPPSAPGAPRVTATKDSGRSLDVTWNEPQNTGKPPITDYDIQYRKFKSSNPDPWQLWPHGTDDDDNADNTDTSTKITRRAPTATADPLEPSTQYEVRVRAKNGEGDTTENWPSVAKATTNPSNSRPSFDRSDALIELRVDENTRAGQNIGSAISASDADSNSLTYTLEGPGKDSFTIVSSSGQIRTKSPLDYETRQSYSLTVKVDDRKRKDNSIAAKSVTIMVDDVREPPPAPAAPRVAGIPGSTSSVRVTWAEPANTGPRIREYDVNYREVGSGPTRWPHMGADRSMIITGLKAGTRYEVQVRARSDEGTGEWSRWGSGSPNPDVANRNPAFSGASRTLSVAENTPPNTDVGAPLAATDRDGDTLTYTLGGADAGSFTIVAGTGQIRTAAVLDEETRSSYTVTVTANDRTTDSVPITVNIAVTDVTFGCASRGAVADTSNRGLVADCEALREARNKLEDGGARLNWFEGTPIDQWQGIKLSGSTPRVTEVDLKGMGLSGTLPAELGDVPMLTKLNLRGNRLTGSIPGSLNRLSRLETLLLHDNMLTGTIPNLSGLRNLEMLWLSGRDMNLTGGVPSWFNSMSSLESVSLWGNSLGGPIPRLTGMTSLNLIKLQSNGFTGNVPAWFADMDSLRTLYLHDNNLNGGIPAAFGQHTRLLRLWLDRNNLTGSIPAALGDMTSLRTLNLRDNQLSGSIPAELGDLSNLQHLRLHNNQLTGSIPAELGDLSSLRQLWVSNNRLSGSIPTALGDLSSLQQLNLHTNQLSGDIPSALGRLSNLTRLRIGGVDGNPGNTGLTGCVPSAIEDATDRDDLALAGSSGISICSP